MIPCSLCTHVHLKLLKKKDFFTAQEKFEDTKGVTEQKTEKFTSQNKDFCWSWAGGPVLVVRAEIYVYM
jgi:hypothetical protein